MCCPKTNSSQLLAWIVGCFLVVAPRAATFADAIDFERDIRPLLSDNCFKCHGPDGKQRKAKLRLDVKSNVLSPREDGTILVAGKPSESEMYLRISSSDPNRRMPPEGSGKSLTAEEIALVKRWIEAGAEWQEHWSLSAPTRPRIPDAKPLDAADEIDAFVRARLDSTALKPSPEADRHTLIRRVTLDLTGLPPTRGEVHDFVNDQSPDAYSRLVDRLLASPTHGEHQAHFWLDAARYADTHGLHLDNLRIMWPYRDWVIEAFNSGMSFDRFTVEQLAGDLLPGSTREQRVATGFNRCNVTTSEGGAIPEEWLVRYAVDRVETTSTVWMGLTAGCAACHDHKFDPVTQKEFYQLFAFFNNITEKAMDGNNSVVPPVVNVPLVGVEEQLAALRARIAPLEEKRATRVTKQEEDFTAWVKAASTDVAARPEPANFIAHIPFEDSASFVANVANGRRGTTGGNGQFVPGKIGQGFAVRNGFVDFREHADFEWNQSFSYGAWIKAKGDINASPFSRMHRGESFRGWDLYVLKQRVAVHLVHKWPEDAVMVATQANVLEAGEWHHVFVTYDGSGRAAGVKVYIDGEEQPIDVRKDTLNEKSIRTTAPLSIGRRYEGEHFKTGEVDDIRIYGGELSAKDVAALADPVRLILAVDSSKRSAAQVEVLREAYLRKIDAEYVRLQTALTPLRERERTLENQSATTLVMEERKEPRGAYVLERGQYDQRREKVVPQTPASLPPMPEGAPANRLGLARWLVAPSHPLVTRVTANRFWQHKFGRGLVKTSEDFGNQGGRPSHPRLLDWLATEFLRTGWDTKGFQRLLVLSATYRQSSRVTQQARVLDPENLFLSHGPRFRLDAETLRDQALAVSGLLVSRIGGPSVKPPQPSGLWYAVGYTASNTARFNQDRGPDTYRRSLYTFWKRTAPPPVMAILDAPSREKCSVRRERTNTPLQALLMMNDQQYVEAARHLARRVIREGDPSHDTASQSAVSQSAVSQNPVSQEPACQQQRASRMFQIVTGRRPDAVDLETLLTCYRGSVEEYRGDPAAAKALVAVGDSKPDTKLDPIELAAWTVVGNLVLNLDEVINKN